MSQALAELRDKLQKFSSSPDMAGKATREIAGSFISAHKSLLQKAQSDLNRTAVCRLIDEVGRRRTHKLTDPAQGDFFRGHSYPDCIVVGKGATRRRTAFKLAMFEEAEEWNEPQAKTKRSHRDASVASILEELRPYHRTGMTVGECMDAADEAKKKGSG